MYEASLQKCLVRHFPKEYRVERWVLSRKRLDKIKTNQTIFRQSPERRRLQMPGVEVLDRGIAMAPSKEVLFQKDIITAMAAQSRKGVC